MKLIVDTDHAYRTAPRYFPTLKSALMELVQNAYRSYWPIDKEAPRKRIDVRLQVDEGVNTIEVTDWGCGIDDPERLLSLHSSRWADDVAGDQDPAGMGAIAPIAHAAQVIWVSDFGELAVDSTEFFNNAEYRDNLLPAPVPTIPRSGGSRTRVTMRGCANREFRELQAAAAKLLSHYVLVDVYVNGHLANKSFMCDTKISLPRMDVRVVFGLSSVFADGWHGDERHDYTYSYRNFVRWHGHLICAGPDLNDLLPELTGPVTGLTFHPSALSFCIDVLDENMVTPVLPDRRYLKADDRTMATLTEAWTAAVAAYDAQLAECVKNPPMTTTSFRRAILDSRSGVDGWVAYAREACDYRCAGTTGVECRSSCVEKVQVVVRKTSKFYDPSAIVIRTPSGDTLLDVDRPVGLLFDPVDSRDFLADEFELYQLANGATHQLVIQLQSDVAFDDKWTPKLVPGTATFYAVPLTVVPESGDLPADLSCYKIAEDETGFIVYDDLESYDLVDSVIGIGDFTVDDLIEAVDDYVRAEDQNNDPDSSFYKDFSDHCDEFKARAENKTFVALDLDELAHRFDARGKKLTLDFAAKTVEVDGVVKSVTWR